MIDFVMVSKKPYINTKLVLLSTLLYVVIAILVIVNFIVILSTKQVPIIGVGILLVLGFANYALSICFDWKIRPHLMLDDSVIIYKFDEALPYVNNTTTTYTITSISNLVVRGKKLILYGDITCKIQMKNAVSVPKVVIPCNFKEKDVVIDKLKEWGNSEKTPLDDKE